MDPKEDRISSMPDIVITYILDCLPLQDAVGTCVLSKNWRNRWTMLSQLIFDEEFRAYLSDTNRLDSYVTIINRLLHHVSGSITVCFLIIDDIVEDEDIDHWISILSRKGTVNLTLKNYDKAPLMLPTHYFSWTELKHLKVFNCCFDLSPSFLAFPSLLGLGLCLSDESSKLVDVAKLENLKLEYLVMAYIESAGNIKLVDIAKLGNLKLLSFSLRDLDLTIITSDTIYELLGSLPKLEDLDLDFQQCELREGGAKKRKRSPVVFPCLMDLTLRNIDFDNDIMVSCFFEVIRSLPNLQNLEIEASGNYDKYQAYPLCSQFCSPEINTMELLHLKSVVLTYYKATENDVYLTKYLLACSPALKRIVIHTGKIFQGYEKKDMFASKLLKLYRASPLVDIDIQ